MPSYIRLDLFPATITRGDGTVHDLVRAVVSEDTLYVFVDDNPTPKLEFEEKLFDFEKIGRSRYKVTADDDGEEIAINKRAGCGCGNKLRGFRAFPGVPLVF